MTDEDLPRRTPRWALLTTALLTLPLLLAYPPLVLTGRFVRPASDDWCLLPIGRHEGFGGVFWDIYSDQNGRFFNAAANALVFSSYSFSSKVGPGLVLLALLVLLAWAGRLVLAGPLGADRPAARLGAVTVAAALVLTMLLGKPTQYQTLYHAPTIITHTLTIVLALVTGIAIYYGQRKGTVHAVVPAVVGGVVLGTFNEAFTATCLVTVAVLLLLRLLTVPVPVGTPALLGAAGGLVAGFASVYLSPGSRSRQGYIKDPNLLDPSLVGDTWHAWVRVVRMTASAPSYTLLVVAGLVVGALLTRTWLRGRRLVVLGLVVPAVWAVGSSLAACFVLTYSFNRQLVLRERTWPSMTITLLLLTAWLALLVGHLVAEAVRALPARRGEVAVALLAVLAVVFGVRGVAAARVEHQLQHRTELRAANFDKMQRDVERQLAAGASTVRVRPVQIDGLYEPFKPHLRADQFPNNCLPDFFGPATYVAASSAKR